MSETCATEIKLRRRSRVLEVSFDDGSRFELLFEYLRVYSPSAEVRSHGSTAGLAGRTRSARPFGRVAAGRRFPTS